MPRNLSDIPYSERPHPAGWPNVDWKDAPEHPADPAQIVVVGAELGPQDIKIGAQNILAQTHVNAVGVSANSEIAQDQEANTVLSLEGIAGEVILQALVDTLGREAASVYLATSPRDLNGTIVRQSLHDINALNKNERHPDNYAGGQGEDPLFKINMNQG